MDIRQSYFAGSWYPVSRSSCIEEIKSYIDENIEYGDIKRVAGIVPHAGWVFSGKVACNVIKILSEAEDVDTVFVLGAHMGMHDRNFIMREGYWDTPVGELEIDKSITDKLCENFDFIIETAYSYQPDNTIELQLPFIKYFFKEVRIVPIGISPRKDTFEIIDFILDNFRDKKLIFLGSTDLTHYGPNYGYTPAGSGQKSVDWVKKENDKKVINYMLKLDENNVIKEAFENRNACCPGAAASAIYAAKKKGVQKGQLLSYTTSYDVSPATSFVGYAGIVY